MNLAKNKVWFSLLGILGVVLVVLLVQTALGKGGNKPRKEKENVSTEAPEEGLKVNAYPKVNALMQKYYQASTHGNTEALKEIVKPFTEADETAATRKSGFVEEYQNLTCYTEDGADQDTYIVFAVYDLKFPNVDTPAPGLETWVVCTDADGGLFINKDQSLLSETMETQIQNLMEREDVKQLNADVESRFATALQADANLNSLYEQMGGQTLGTPSGTAAPGGTDPNATPAPVGDVKKEMMAIIDLDIYRNPQEGEAIDNISVGKTLWVDSNVEGGYSYVDKEGVTGYVRTAGLADYEPVDEEITATINYYGSCSPAAPVVGTITSDRPYYCTLKFDNGWRQILVDDQKVYIKESDLTGGQAGVEDEGDTEGQSDGDGGEDTAADDSGESGEDRSGSEEE